MLLGAIGLLLALAGCDQLARFTASDAAIAADAMVNLDVALDGPRDGVVDGPPDGEQGRDVRVDAPLVNCRAIEGMFCKSNSDCKGHPCAITTTRMGTGVCACDCTVDDPASPLVNEDDCPLRKGPGTVCAVIRNGATTLTACLKTCEPRLDVASGCPPQIACHPRSNAYSGSPLVAVCAVSACAKGNDCPVFTALACTGPAHCPLNERCLMLSLSGAQGLCARDGRCSAVSGLCQPSSTSGGVAAIGDPCAADADCPKDTRCQVEIDRGALLKGGDACSFDEQCCSQRCDASGACSDGSCGLFSRNGYCTSVGCTFSAIETRYRCPGASICSRRYPGGVCLKACDLATAATCRGVSGDKRGDYECRNWSRLSVGPLLVSDKPVCEWGTSLACATGATAFACAAIGVGSTNATNMACRTVDGTVITVGGGFCFDDTHSGP